MFLRRFQANFSAILKPSLAWLSYDHSDRKLARSVNKFLELIVFVLVFLS